VLWPQTSEGDSTYACQIFISSEDDVLPSYPQF
jgi:hypothetical protein